MPIPGMVREPYFLSKKTEESYFCKVAAALHQVTFLESWRQSTYQKYPGISLRLIQLQCFAPALFRVTCIRCLLLAWLCLPRECGLSASGFLWKEFAVIVGHQETSFFFCRKMREFGKHWIAWSNNLEVSLWVCFLSLSYLCSTCLKASCEYFAKKSASMQSPREDLRFNFRQDLACSSYQEELLHYSDSHTKNLVCLMLICPCYLSAVVKGICMYGQNEMPTDVKSFFVISCRS